MRTCNICIYYKEGRWARTESICTRPHEENVHIVTGEILPLFCHEERVTYGGQPINCGERGRFWTPKAE